LKETISALCDRLEARFIKVRRALHGIPEASFGEFKTEAAICSYLKEAGIRFRRGVGGTGIVGIIRGSGKRTIALRADMDALNVPERTGLPFASRHQGYMHACGHDAHMAMVLGAGLVLKRLGKHLPGQVKLIFQPAEETPPGGALAMIRQGVLKAPRVDAIVGIHVDPMIPRGKLAVNPGVISAAADDFRIIIRGRGGHGSSPHRAVDTIVVAAQFVTSLQAVVSRRVSPVEDAVISIGSISGGERSNVIAETVEMEGTIRTHSKILRRRIPSMVKRLLHSTCTGFGARGRFEYIKGYPPLVCDEALTDTVRTACTEFLGSRGVIRSPGFEMGGEDFAYYAERVPGTVIFLGVGRGGREDDYMLHHTRFDIDEKALKIGVAALANTACRYLGSRGRKHGGSD
jgi:amidohydrolase